jgi:SH3-like domain-containing protein
VAWIHRRLTSGEATVMRVKTTRLALHKKPRAEAEIVAYLNPRSIAELVKDCEKGWCKVRGEGVSGWAPAGELWGVSPAIQCKVGGASRPRSR